MKRESKFKWEYMNRHIILGKSHIVDYCVMSEPYLDLSS